MFAVVRLSPSPSHLMSSLCKHSHREKLHQNISIYHYYRFFSSPVKILESLLFSVVMLKHDSTLLGNSCKTIVFNFVKISQTDGIIKKKLVKGKIYILQKLIFCCLEKRKFYQNEEKI